MHLHWVCIGVVAAACPLCTVHAGRRSEKKSSFLMTSTGPVFWFRRFRRFATSMDFLAAGVGD